MKTKSGKIILIVIGVILLVALIKILPTIKLSGENKNGEPKMEEVEVVKENIDEKKIKKNKKKNKQTVIDNVVFEDATKEDMNGGNAISNVVNGVIETEVKNLPNDLFDWENYVPSPEDLVIPTNMNDEVNNK